MNQDISFCVVALLASVAFLIKNLLKFSNLNTANTLSVVSSVLIASIFSLELVTILDKFLWLDFTKYFGQLFMSLNFTFLTIIALVSVAELNPKIIKTLWRLPVIGGLLSLFDAQYHLTINIAVVAVILIILFVSKNELRIYISRIIGYGIFASIVSFYGTTSLLISNLSLIGILLITSSLLDAVRVKFIVFNNMEKN